MYREAPPPMCPACPQVGLKVATALGVPRWTCGRCQGQWFEEGQVAALAEALELKLDDLLRPEPSPPGPRRCPTCGTGLRPFTARGARQFVLEACPGHGVWFDATELERVLDRIHWRGVLYVVEE